MRQKENNWLTNKSYPLYHKTTDTPQEHHPPTPDRRAPGVPFIPQAAWQLGRLQGQLLFEGHALAGAQQGAEGLLVVLIGVLIPQDQCAVASGVSRWVATVLQLGGLVCRSAKFVRELIMQGVFRPAMPKERPRFFRCSEGPTMAHQWIPLDRPQQREPESSCPPQPTAV